MPHDHSNRSEPDRPSSISRYVFFGFLAVAGYFLITEHRAHLFGILPFLLLAACPLMHFFHHRGHGGHDGTTSGDAPRSETTDKPADTSHRHF